MVISNHLEIKPSEKSQNEKSKKVAWEKRWLIKESEHQVPNELWLKKINKLCDRIHNEWWKGERTSSLLEQEIADLWTSGFRR